MQKPNHLIRSIGELEHYYGAVNERSLGKVAERLTPPYRRLIEAAPFFVIASVGAEGLDCSPRGDTAGFVRIIDDRTLAIPDRRGNNRLDTLRNIVENPRVGLLFLIPGMNETLRVNGRAVLSVEPNLLQSFAVDGCVPATVMIVSIEAVYFQCARALIRSQLWSPEARVDRSQLPTAGQMAKSMMEDFDAESYDAVLAERQKATLY